MITSSPTTNTHATPDGEYSRSGEPRSSGHANLLGYLLILPAILVVIAVLVYPTLFNVGIAIREWSWSAPANADKPFVGLTNFMQLFNSARFWNSLRISLTVMIISVALQYVLGLGLALLLNKKFRGLRVFRAIFILPMILAPIVIGIQWRYLLSGNFGVLNYVLGQVGMIPPRWLSEPGLGLLILVTVDTWTWVPFVALILLSALQQIPQEVLEAAQVDGATSIRRLYYIILPLLRPATVIVLLLRSTEIFRAFDVVYVLTGGGPGRTTEVLGMLLYRLAFGEGNLGLAAALSIFIGAVGMIIGTVLIRTIQTEVRLF
jgi:multiple sugar transport system permease protein